MNERGPYILPRLDPNFVGPQPPAKYEYKLDLNHSWTRSGKVDVYRRTHSGLGSSFTMLGECGCFVNGEFVLLTVAFADDFKKN